MALDTASIEIARARRDALAKADELLWRSLQAGRPKALDSYEAAKHRAMSRGFIYIPAEDLAVEATLDEILERLKKLDVEIILAPRLPLHAFHAEKTLYEFAVESQFANTRPGIRCAHRGRM